MSRVKKSAQVAGMLVVLTGSAEGLRQTAYPDPATRGKPWTVCFGHTGPEVGPGYHLSLTECRALLLRDLDRHAEPIEKCVPYLKTAPVQIYVASVDFAVNLGPRAFCKSSIAAHMNAGRVRQACDVFPAYNRAAGIVFPGLTRRRSQERKLCIEGLEKPLWDQSSPYSVTG